MINWIVAELGRETVFHISRYFPSYKLTTEATPVTSVQMLKRLAEKELSYVYTGNIYAESNDTHCLLCNNLLISRHSYSTSIVGIDGEGRCKKCGNYFHKKT
jgi:pyruvate formate lyase activating enzyme